MSDRKLDRGLVEVLKRPCSGAAQPVEYHSTIRRVAVPADVAKKISNSPSAEELRNLPRPVGTVTKQVQSREEMRGLVTVISRLESRSVSFEAPSGVGKSTVFPWELHRNTPTVVVVLSPNEVVAQAHVEEVKKLGQTATYVSPARMSVENLQKSMGVVYTTSAGLIMRALSARKDDSGLEADMTVVHDESHVVDADAQFLASMWPDYLKVVKFISVSAYGSPKPADAYFSRDVTVVSVPFCEESNITPADVTLEGKPAPWAISNLLGKRTLMFIESDRFADYLASAYGNFIETMTLRRYQGYSQYVKVLETLTAQDKPVLVLVDAEFQYGMKMPADQIIDFGYARHTVAGGGMQPVDTVVRINAIESAARVNILATATGEGQKPKVAYVPDDPTSDVVRRLSRPENDKVAAYCELFRYKVPPDAEPRVNAEMFHSADMVEFLSSGLPWEVWSNTAFKARREVAAVPVESSAPSSDGILDWIGTSLNDPGPVQLKSGQFYSDEQGNVTATLHALDGIMSEYGDLYLWLREKIRGPGVLKFSDLSTFDQEAVWLVWLSAWNANVADLVALDKWRALHGAIVADWRNRTDCRVRMSMLLKLARDIHDKWTLLSSWYRMMYRESPKVICEAPPDTLLIDGRFAGMVSALGTSVAIRHPLGSTSMSSTLAAASARISPMDASRDDSEMLISFNNRKAIRDYK